MTPHRRRIESGQRNAAGRMARNDSDVECTETLKMDIKLASKTTVQKTYNAIL